MKRLWALALLTACYSMSTMQEPKPLPPGAVRGAAGLGFDARSAGPSLQAALRVGIVDHVETRLKLSVPGQGQDEVLGGFEAGLNVQPWDSERVGVFLMPHYRFYDIKEDYDDFLDEYTSPTRRIQAFSMPSLAVFHLQPFELFVGPDLQAGTRSGRGFFALGGHLGASVAAGRHVNFTLESGVVSSVAGQHQSRNEYGELSQSVLTVGKLSAEIGFSVSFGSAYLK